MAVTDSARALSVTVPAKVTLAKVVLQQKQVLDANCKHLRALLRFLSKLRADYNMFNYNFKTATDLKKS